MSTSASVTRRGGLATVALTGDVDIASGPVVEEAIREAITADEVDAVLVDLSAVPFLDSSGIGLLLKGRRLAAERETAYRIIGAHGVVRRMMELSGVWEHLCGASNQSAQA